MGSYYNLSHEFPDIHPDEVVQGETGCSWMEVEVSMKTAQAFGFIDDIDSLEAQTFKTKILGRFKTATDFLCSEESLIISDENRDPESYYKSIGLL